MRGVRYADFKARLSLGTRPGAGVTETRDRVTIAVTVPFDDSRAALRRLVGTGHLDVRLDPPAANSSRSISLADALRRVLLHDEPGSDAGWRIRA
jgi:hypothetical protein